VNTFVICVADDDEKWSCFICDADPLSHLVKSCAELIGRHRKSSLKGSHNLKRRKSASNVTHVPQKQHKSAAVITIEPTRQKQDRRKLAPMRGRLAVSKMQKVPILGQQAMTGPTCAVSGGIITIKRPEYDADMIPVNEHNVWPVLEKLLAATQSMSMLLGSLKDDLQRSSALAAQFTDFVASSEDLTSEITLKRREASLKLWRAFDAYQKSFVDIESYSRETSKAAQSTENSNVSNNCSSSTSVNDRDQTAISN